jgi:L,D-peptidoglycan transpeptidase YkuD (ErfK/YbiS/YcfS/YnhG family)
MRITPGKELFYFSIIVFNIAATAQAFENPTEEARQMLLVVADNWSSRTAVFQRFERVSLNSGWLSVGAKHKMVLGKNGLAWGKGLHAPEIDSDPVKREGDGRSPAGVFGLSGVFGLPGKLRPLMLKMPQKAINNDTECVDDPGSKYYNRMLEKTTIPNPDWHSSEKMSKVGFIYNLGVLVKHNPDAIPEAGSCIFLHIWRDPKKPTVGCSAVSDKDILKIALWLNSADHPVLVQLTRQKYSFFRKLWELPEI